MPLYYVKFRDPLTDKEHEFRVESNSRSNAEKEARRHAVPVRGPAPADYKGYKKAALEVLKCRKMSMHEHRIAFKARMMEIGRWDEALRYRQTIRKRMTGLHPDWTPEKTLKRAWVLMMEAYPPSLSVRCPDGGRRDTAEEIAKHKADAEKRAGFKMGLLEPPVKASDGVVKPVEHPLDPKVQQTAVEAQAVLLARALDSSDRGDIRDDTEWTYQNLDVAWPDIDVETVPSPGAVALLKEAKDGKDGRRWFLTTYHVRTLPSKTKIESDGWLEADDGQVADMANRVREEMRMQEEMA